MEDDRLISRDPANEDYIDRLPAELLASVFLYVRDGEHPNLLWVRVMLVCRRWRQIGKDTAALWSTFYSFVLSAEALELHIQRSQTAPLVIWLSSGDFGFRTIQPWLTTHRARIQHLQLYDLHDEDADADAFCQELLSYDLPTVVTLDILNGYKSLPIFPPSQASRFPNLRKLQLFGWELAHGFDISKLSSLMLRECKLETWAGDSPDRFVEILATCPSLEELGFSCCSFSPALLADSPSSSSSPGRIASFPRLTEFIFRASHRANPAILTHIHIPSTARVTLQDPPILDAPEEHGNLVLPGRRTLPILACCTLVYVHHTGYGGSDTINGGSIAVHWDRVDFARSMRECVLFASSSVVRLSIRAHNMADASQDLYFTVLNAFPLLESIHLDIYRTDTGFFAALCADSQARPGQRVCARLKLIKVEAQPSIALLDTLEGCARVRHECGLRFPEVVLSLHHAIDRRDSPRLRPDGTFSEAPDFYAISNDGDEGSGDDGDSARGDAVEDPSHDSSEEDLEGSDTDWGSLNPERFLGTWEEFNYWKGEFVVRLKPFVDEIVYERA